MSLNGSSGPVPVTLATVSFDRPLRLRYLWNTTQSSASPPPPPPPPPPPGTFAITLRTTGLTARRETIFQQAADRWAQIIVGDLPDVTYNGVAVDDLLIDASAMVIDGQGGILGSAGPDRFRSGSNLPYHGSMTFDSADLAMLESTNQLFSVVLHEMGHVLGLGTIWATKGLLTGAGTSDPEFTGALRQPNITRFSTLRPPACRLRTPVVPGPPMRTGENRYSATN